MDGFPDLPPVWAGAFVILQRVLALVLPVERFGPWSVPLGSAAFAAGLALILWAALWFRRKRTAIEPRKAPSALIVEGPFRLNRNPIYTGMALILVGTALWFGALSALFLVPVFVILITRRFVLAEEEGLRRAFGAEAERYLAATRRW